MLGQETGRYATINELAAAEKTNSSYVSRMLCLTLLAPDIVDAILDGQQLERNPIIQAHTQLRRSSWRSPGA